MILREARRRRLTISARSEQQQQPHHRHLAPLLLPLRAMSAVAEAPPAAKKPKTVYGDHTREVRLCACELHWASIEMHRGEKKLTRRSPTNETTRNCSPS